MLSQTLSSIRISGLAALALATACGGDDEPSANPGNGGFDAAVTAPEAGVPEASTGTGVDAGQCLVTQFGTGAPCALPGSTLGGYRMCVNGVPTGECMSFLGGGDGGVDLDAAIGALRDSGLITVGEGGLTIGDATITLPEAGAIKCPAPYMCLDAFKSFTGGLSACGEMGGIVPLPPPGDCTTGSGPCKLGGVSGMCVNAVLANACVVVCN